MQPPDLPFLTYWRAKCFCDDQHKPYRDVADQHPLGDDGPRGDKSDRVNYVQKALDELLAGKPVTTTQTKAYGWSVKYAS